MTLNEGLGHSFGTKLLRLPVTAGVPSLIRFTDILVQANFFFFLQGNMEVWLNKVTPLNSSSSSAFLAMLDLQSGE